VPGWVKARTDDDEDSESEEDLLITETFDTANDVGEQDLEPISDEENFVLNEAADAEAGDIMNDIPLIPAVAEKTDKVI